jgi:predicted secreted protein
VLGLAMLLAGGLAMASAEDQEALDSAVDYGPLGRGRVQVSFLKAASGAVVLDLSTDLEQVAGVLVTADGRNLVAITSGDAQGRARRQLAGLEAEMKLEIGGSSLAGERPQAVLPADLKGAREVRLTLFAQDGTRYPLAIQANDFVGLTVAAAFTGLSGNCKDVTIECSNGCKKTVNCCSMLICATCTPCDVLCGQSCLPATPAATD